MSKWTFSGSRGKCTTALLLLLCLTSNTLASRADHAALRPRSSFIATLTTGSLWAGEHTLGTSSSVVSHSSDMLLDMITKQSASV